MMQERIAGQVTARSIHTAGGRDSDEQLSTSGDTSSAGHEEAEVSCVGAARVSSGLRNQIGQHRIADGYTDQDTVHGACGAALACPRDAHDYTRAQADGGLKLPCRK